MEAELETAPKPSSLWARFKAWCSRTVKAIGNFFSNLWRKITGKRSVDSKEESGAPESPPAGAGAVAAVKPRNTTPPHAAQPVGVPAVDASMDGRRISPRNI